MAKDKPEASKNKSIKVKAFADHHVITQPNPLRKVLHRVADTESDDPVA
ncbi:MAG: Hpt domain-containing protein, partial [Bradyrhizobium sp.]